MKSILILATLLSSICHADIRDGVIVRVQQTGSSKKLCVQQTDAPLVDKRDVKCTQQNEKTGNIHVSINKELFIFTVVDVSKYSVGDHVRLNMNVTLAE